MSVLNNRITYLLTYIYMRDTTLLLIYYGPVLNAPAIFELVVVGVMDIIKLIVELVRVHLTRTGVRRMLQTG